MKKFYMILSLLIAAAWTTDVEAQTLSYKQGNAATATSFYSGGLETTISYLSTCQESVSATFDCYDYGNSVWSSGNYEYYVNGTLIGTASGAFTMDLTPYIPVNSIRIKKIQSANWNEVHLTVLVGLPTGSFPEAPVVSNLTYCKNETAVPLTATLGASGTGLKWYTSETGLGFTTTPPTPSTAAIGTLSYWVAQADASGCESERSLIEVSIVEPNTSLTQTGNEISVAQSGAVYQWGICGTDNSFTPISNANAQNYLVTTPGLYAVDVTFDTCTSRSICYEVATLDVDSLQSVTVRVYPNPTANHLTVELGNAFGAKLFLYDMNGRQLMEKTTETAIAQINLDNLTAGMYLLQIETAQGTENKKIIKQ